MVDAREAGYCSQALDPRLIPPGLVLFKQRTGPRVVPRGGLSCYGGKGLGFRFSPVAALADSQHQRHDTVSSRVVMCQAGETFVSQVQTEVDRSEAGEVDGGQGYDAC